MPGRKRQEYHGFWKGYQQAVEKGTTKAGSLPLSGIGLLKALKVESCLGLESKRIFEEDLCLGLD